MAGERFQASSIRAIVTGIGLAVIGSVLIICNISNIMKTGGWLLLLIPQRLGVIEPTSPNEIMTIELSTPDHEISMARPGPYLVYYDFPFVTGDSSGQDAPPHLALTCGGSDEQVRLDLVERGLRPYDTPFAGGRPVYQFNLSAPGSCRLIHSARPTNISIVPDHITGKEAAITASYAAQLAVLCAVFGTPLYMRVRHRRRQWKEHRQQAAARTEAMRRALLSNETERRQG